MLTTLRAARGSLRVITQPFEAAGGLSAPARGVRTEVTPSSRALVARFLVEGSKDVVTLRALDATGNPLGSVRWALKKNGEAAFDDLEVKAEARGQGLGRVLMDQALARIRGQGARRAVLWIRPFGEGGPDASALARFYETFGFKVNGEMAYLSLESGVARIEPQLSAPPTLPRAPGGGRCAPPPLLPEGGKAALPLCASPASRAARRDADLGPCAPVRPLFTASFAASGGMIPPARRSADLKWRPSDC